MISLAQGAMTIPLGLQLGVGGILTVLILRTVFDFLERYKGRMGGNGNTPAWSKTLIKQIEMALTVQAEMKKQITDLYQWHKPDDGGEQSWKNTRMIKLMEDTNELMREHHAVLRQLLPVMESVNKALAMRGVDNL